MKEKVIVGVDFSSTSTGVAGLNAKSGEFLFSYLVAPKVKDFDTRVGVIYKTLEEILADLDVVVVANEQNSFGSKGRVVSLAQGLGYIRYSLMALGYKTVLFSPSEIKKFYTGNGRANKEDMIESTPKELIEEFEAINPNKIDDLVDSYAIAKLAYSKLQEGKL
jgi:Holliday junction resolvasome RuvABC endonuclease subunit